MVGSEATMAGVNISTISSNIGERGERFPVRSESITIKFGVTIVSSWIKTEEGF